MMLKRKIGFKKQITEGKWQSFEVHQKKMQVQSPQYPYKCNILEQAHQAWKHPISPGIIHSAIDKYKK